MIEKVIIRHLREELELISVADKNFCRGIIYARYLVEHNWNVPSATKRSAAWVQSIENKTTEQYLSSR